MFELRYFENVARLSLDESRCIGCGMCTIVCPHAVFELQDQKSRIVDHGACMECGACSQNCESKALTVEPGVGCAAAIIYASLTGREIGCG